MTKPELRRALRERRRRFAASAPPPIVIPPPFTERLTPGAVLAAYHPIAGEADPAPLVAAARAAGMMIALPHLTSRDAALSFREWHAMTALVPGPFGHQPHESTSEVTPAIILVPLVGFDDALNRLGQGGGHYDRALAAWPDAWAVGVAWSVQRVDELPADPWDMPLNAVVTEQDWITR